MSPDLSDPKLAHLDGLDLSRAGMLEGVAAGLPKNNKRIASIMATTEAHNKAWVGGCDKRALTRAVIGWAAFAVYLVTKRGTSR